MILVGEMRDEETVQDRALGGRDRTPRALDDPHGRRARVDQPHARLLPAPPARQARSMIAGTIKGVISQRLVPGADGGRVAVCEILRMTGRVRDMIVDPSQTGKLMEVIASGSYYGMQTFDQALFGPCEGRPGDVRGSDESGVESVRLQAFDAGRRTQGHDDGGRGRRPGPPRHELRPRERPPPRPEPAAHRRVASASATSTCSVMPAAVTLRRRRRSRAPAAVVDAVAHDLCGEKDLPRRRDGLRVIALDEPFCAFTGRDSRSVTLILAFGGT